MGNGRFNEEIDSSILFRDLRWVLANVTCFCAARLGYPIIAVRSKLFKGKSRLGRVQTQSEKAEETLLALKEFKRYLEGLEKDLSRTSKKYSNREIGQGVGFVAAGIHEALNYLEIVKKVIVKTERVVAKRNSISENARLSASD